MIIELEKITETKGIPLLTASELMSAKTDEELIQQVRSGHLDAYRYLVERYQGRVATTVKAMLGETNEAEDVGQETFIRFYKSIHSFRGDSSVSTYLHRIAVNLSLNELKRRKRFLSRFERQDDHHTVASASRDKLEELENKQLIQQALLNLKPDFRAVVVLRYIEGYSTKETAELLNIPLGTVLSRLSRAQNKLRDFLLPIVNDETR
ncbi:MAG: RNA polymerase sigma factor [Rhodothermaceae bacterium]|nr:RNA polymerase sigma factor [Rhodothermaceae bacterium]